jgi:phosphoglycerate dehydrogenase-like enzyme
VLPKADFVVVTTPLTPETHGLMSRERLDLMKPGAGLVNIGRAPIVDYAALVEKLEKRELSGAVLDVFEPEPLPADSKLWSVPNLVITPHVTCDDPRYVDQLFDTWFENLERFVAGKKLKNVVDRKLGY